MSRNQLNKEKFLSPAEREHLEKLAWRLYASEPRDSLIVLLALHTGARPQELLNVELKDIDASDNTIHIRGLKGSNDRDLPLKPELFKALQDYAATVSGPMLFDIKYRRLEQVWQNLRPAKKSFKSLRHTFAITLYDKWRDIKLVQIALGHRSLSSTMVYVDFVYSADQLKKIIE